MRQALGITVLMLAVAATPPVEAAAQDILDRVLAAAVESRTNDLGHREADLGDGHVFVLVPAGPFAMGSEEGLDDELPVHEVELDDYWVAAFPVTVGQFRAFVEATGYVTDAERGMGSWQWTGEIPGPGDRGDPWRPMSDGAWHNIYFEQGGDHAVGSVSWNDAQAFCAWLSEQLGVPVVLPTEAQWEKAARGTDGRRFPWGNDAPDGNRANYADVNFIGKYGEYTRRSDSTVDDGHVETSPVDAYPAGRSPYGVYDLAGNLGEWVHDVYDDGYYERSPRRNPSGPERPADVPDERVDRVNRGGSWVDWAGVEANGAVAPQGGHSIRSAARTRRRAELERRPHGVPRRDRRDPDRRGTGCVRPEAGPDRRRDRYPGGGGQRRHARSHPRRRRQHSRLRRVRWDSHRRRSVGRAHRRHHRRARRPRGRRRTWAALHRRLLSN